MELEPETAVQPLSVAEHGFHEGASVKTINGKYYFLFTDTHRHADLNNGVGMATSLGYAVSDHPMSGFVYKGIVVDNIGCDPHTWNNRGSLQCFGGQWYIFYHRSTHAGVFSRRVCMEPIELEADGVHDLLGSRYLHFRLSAHSRASQLRFDGSCSDHRKHRLDPSPGALLYSTRRHGDLSIFGFQRRERDDPSRVRQRLLYGGGEGGERIMFDDHMGGYGCPHREYRTVIALGGAAYRNPAFHR